MVHVDMGSDDLCESIQGRFYIMDVHDLIQRLEALAYSKAIDEEPPKVIGVENAVQIGAVNLLGPMGHTDDFSIGSFDPRLRSIQSGSPMMNLIANEIESVGHVSSGRLFEYLSLAKDGVHRQQSEALLRSGVAFDGQGVSKGSPEHLVSSTHTNNWALRRGRRLDNAG